MVDGSIMVSTITEIFFSEITCVMESLHRRNVPNVTLLNIYIFC